MPAVDVSEIRVTAKNVDFSNCDRELVQFPGAIQPHGAMLVVDEPDYVIRQASANCHALLGRGPEELIGRSITELFGDATARLLDQLHRASLDHTPVHVVRRVLRRLDQQRGQYIRSSQRRIADTGA